MTSDLNVDIDIYLTRDKKEPLLGQLITKDEHHFIKFNLNPFAPKIKTTLQIVYCESATKLYSLVHCIFYHHSAGSTIYLINELYEGPWLKDGISKIYKCLSVNLSHLTSWIRPNLIDQTQITKGDFWHLTKVRHGNSFSVKIDNLIELYFHTAANINTQKNKVLITEFATLEITSKDLVSRQKLFKTLTSFSNLFTLFLNKIPIINDLKFVSNDGECKLILLTKKAEEKHGDVLIHLEEFVDLEKVIAVYFKKELEFNNIISLWKASFRDIDTQIKFLYLTQSLEYLHKHIFDNKKEMEEKVKGEVSSLYGKKIKMKNWVQIMRYYHLYEFIKDNKLNIPFNKEQKEFLSYLRDSRNYYTHQTNEKLVWNTNELYEVNNILRIWIRCILLKKMAFKNDHIQSIINRENRHGIDLDIFKNPFSMRYKEIAKDS